MARIPRAESVGRSASGARAPIATYDTRQVGAPMAHLATAVNTELDSRARYQYAQAASEFLVKKAQQDSAYDTDQEYGTIEQRYTQQTGKSLDEAAALISDTRVRNEFMAQYRPQVAEGTARIRGIAQGRERDYQRGYVRQQLAAMTDVGLTGDIQNTIGTAQALLVTSRDRGYVSPEEYAEWEREFRTGLAERRVEMLAPRDQLTALGQPWATNIPADRRAIMERSARKLVVDEEAITRVDHAMANITGAGVTRSDVYANFANITDPDVRVATEQRFEQQYLRHQANRSEQAGAIMQKYTVGLRLGEIKFSEIPREDLLRLTELDPDGGAIANLQASELRGTTPAQNTASRVAYVELLSAANRVEAGLPPLNVMPAGYVGPPIERYATAAQELLGMLGERSALLDDPDFEHFTKIAVDGVVPPDQKQWLTLNQRLTDTLDMIYDEKMDGYQRDTAYARERQSMQAWREGVKLETGKYPDAPAEQKYLDQLVLKPYQVDNDYWFTGSTPWAALTLDRKQDEVRRIVALDRVRAAEVQKRLPSLATDDPDAFMALYLKETGNGR